MARLEFDKKYKNIVSNGLLYPNKENTVIMFFHSDWTPADIPQKFIQVIIGKDGWAYNVRDVEHSFPVYKEEFHFYEMNILTGEMIKLDLSNVSPNLC